MGFKSIIGVVCTCLAVVSFNVNAALVNVALTGTASQSSTYPSSGGITNVAGNAIDGNTGGQGGVDLLAHTLFEANPWWRVDLDDDYTIDNIAIWNRTDGSQNRLSNFTVSVLDNNDLILWSTVFSGTAGAPTIFDLSLSSPLASAVKIQLNGSNYLHLAEVQVFSAVPVPAAVWLFGSGLIGLIGVARRKASA